MAKSKHNRKYKPRRVINTLYLMAGLQKLGDSAESFVLQADGALFAIEQGRGLGDHIRTLTLFMAALFDAAVHYESRAARELFDKHGDTWVTAAERCAARGMTDRIVLTGDEVGVLREFIAAARAFLPEVEVGPWRCFVENAQRRWDKHAGQSPAFKPYAEAA
jgi:hypothetical protein